MKLSVSRFQEFDEFPWCSTFVQPGPRLATEGDLFNWVEHMSLAPGPEREGWGLGAPADPLSDLSDTWLFLLQASSGR